MQIFLKHHKEFNTDEFCEDFLTNKGDSLITEANPVDRFFNPFFSEDSSTVSVWGSQANRTDSTQSISSQKQSTELVPQTRGQKRLRSELDGFDDRTKDTRYLLETKYYQTLFLGCLHYMTLEEIAAVCFHAPVPIFVKVLLYIYFVLI